MEHPLAHVMQVIKPDQLRLVHSSLFHHHHQLKPFSFTPIPKFVIGKQANWASSSFTNRLGRAPLVTISASCGSANSFVKPEILLPTGEAIKPAQVKGGRQEESCSLYVVTLLTSKEKASSLSDVNGGILIALIGENRAAIIERISAGEQSETDEDGVQNSYNQFRFQKGSVDTVKFYGPNVGQLAALWIAPGSGTWRLDEAIVTVVPCREQAEETESPSEVFSSSSSAAL